MKMKKKILVFAMVMVMLFAQAMPVSAAEVAFANATPEQQAAINSGLSLLPGPIVALLDRYSRQVTSVEFLSSYAGGAGQLVAGAAICDYVLQTREILNREFWLAGGSGEMKHNVIHETGHVVDYEYMAIHKIKASEAPEFQQIFAEEAAKAAFPAYGYHYRKSAFEYFAESFASYYENPGVLAACPKTMAYIAAVASEFN